MEIDQPQNSDLSISDMVDLFGEDDKPNEEVVKEEPESKEEPEPDSEKKDEEESDKEEDSDSDSDKKEDEDEEETPDEFDFHRVPKRQEILKKFPDLFKTFPALNNVIYREQQYAEYFPTPNDAKYAREQLANFAKVEEDLNSGDISGIFKLLSNHNPDAFNKVSDNLLGTLKAVNEDAYYDTLDRIVKSTLAEAVESGKSSDDEQLQLAARILHKWIYKTDQVKPYQKAQPEKKVGKEEEEFRKKNIEFARQQFTTAMNDVSERTTNIIKANIERNIDPKNLMSPYIREKAIGDIIAEVKNVVNSDRRLESVLRGLWDEARKGNYSEAHKEKIKAALIAKAKAVLPEITKNIQNKALKNISVKRKKEEDEEITVTPRKIRTESSSSQGKSKDGRGMKTLDFFNQD